MTQIDFYTHVNHKLATACHLVAKAFARGARVMVLAASERESEELDRLLWSTPPIGFVPHCSPRDRLAALTPVLIDHTEERLLHDELLINLRSECPASFSRFQHLIEIVSLDPADVAAGRSRWRFYRDRGYQIASHRSEQTRL
jgi:DNA polymerase-3 subunit chi